MVSTIAVVDYTVSLSIHCKTAREPFYSKQWMYAMRSKKKRKEERVEIKPWLTVGLAIAPGNHAIKSTETLNVCSCGGGALKTLNTNKSLLVDSKDTHVLSNRAIPNEF